MSKTIAEQTRYLKLNTGFPKSLWAKAVNIACYVTNGSQWVALYGKAAEEVWIGNRVDYFVSRVFGCPTYVYVYSDQKSELDQQR